MTETTIPNWAWFDPLGIHVETYEFPLDCGHHMYRGGITICLEATDEPKPDEEKWITLFLDVYDSDKKKCLKKAVECVSGMFGMGLITGAGFISESGTLNEISAEELFELNPKKFLAGTTESGDRYMATQEKWQEYRQAWAENDTTKVLYFEEGQDPDFYYEP